MRNKKTNQTKKTSEEKKGDFASRIKRLDIYSFFVSVLSLLATILIAVIVYIQAERLTDETSIIAEYANTLAEQSAPLVYLIDVAERTSDTLKYRVEIKNGVINKCGAALLDDDEFVLQKYDSAKLTNEYIRMASNKFNIDISYDYLNRIDDFSFLFFYVFGGEGSVNTNVIIFDETKEEGSGSYYIYENLDIMNKKTISRSLSGGNSLKYENLLEIFNQFEKFHKQIKEYK